MFALESRQENSNVPRGSGGPCWVSRGFEHLQVRAGERLPRLAAGRRVQRASATERK